MGHRLVNYENVQFQFACVLRLSFFLSLYRESETHLSSIGSRRALLPDWTVTLQSG